MNATHFLYAAAALMLAAAPATAQSAPAPRDTAGYEVKDVEQAPRLLNSRATAAAMSRVYPEAYRMQGVTGSVTIRFRVLENGTVDGQTVAASRGSDPLFAEAAVYVARQMRFRPARVNRQPVRAWVTLPVSFDLATPANHTAPSCRDQTRCMARTP